MKDELRLERPMTNEPNLDEAPSSHREVKQDEHTIGSSSIYRLCEEIIALREINNRQHKMFEQTLAKTRDAAQTSFNSFAADTQRAYQQLRQEFHGEKRISLALLNELVEIAFDMQHIVTARPLSPSPLGGEGGVRGSTDPEAAQQVSGADLRAAHAVSGTDAETFARWAEAVEVQARKVQAALLRHGIHPYDAVIGSSYNPALHERV